MASPNYTPRDHAGCIFCGKHTDHTFDECDYPVRAIKSPTNVNESIAQKAWIIGVLTRKDRQSDRLPVS